MSQFARINRPNNKPLILVRDTSEYHLNSNRDVFILLIFYL